MCKKLNKADEECISRIIMGATPEIQSYLLDKSPDTMDELEKYARRAEQISKVKATAASGSQIAAFSELLCPLMDKLDVLAAFQVQHSQPTDKINDSKWQDRNMSQTQWSAPSRPQNQWQGSYRQPPQMKCSYCDRAGHMNDACLMRQRGQPPFRQQRPQSDPNIRCYRCNGQGHTQSVCPSPRTSTMSGRRSQSVPQRAALN